MPHTSAARRRAPSEDRTRSSTSARWHAAETSWAPGARARERSEPSRLEGERAAENTSRACTGWRWRESNPRALLARHRRVPTHIPAGRRRIERRPPDLETGWPPWPATWGAAYEDRTRLTRSTIELRHQSHHAARWGAARSRTYRRGSQPRLPTEATAPWCTPSVSSRALRVFSAALSPDQLEVRTPFGNQTRLARLKGEHPHQKTNGALGGSRGRIRTCIFSGNSGAPCHSATLKEGDGSFRAVSAHAQRDPVALEAERGRAALSLSKSAGHTCPVSVSEPGFEPG